MTSSFYRRPRTEAVRGNFGLRGPNRQSLGNSVRITGLANGRIIDSTNPQQAGVNAGQTFKELGAFLEQTIEVVPPIVKDVMQSKGIEEANALLSDPAFRSGLRNGNAEQQAIFDSIGNPFARDTINASLGSGAAAQYNEALESFLFRDDALTTRLDGEDDAAFRSRTRQLRVERQQEALSAAGWDTLSPEARQFAQPLIFEVDNAAQGKVFGQQAIVQQRGRLAELGLAVERLGSTYSIETTGLNVGSNQPGATPEAQTAAAERMQTAGARYAVDLDTLFAAKNLGPAAARQVLAKEIQRLGANPTAESLKQLQLLTYAIGVRDPDGGGYLLTLAGQDLANTSGPNGGPTLLSFAESQKQQLETAINKQETERAQSLMGGAIQGAEALLAAGDFDGARSAVTAILGQVSPGNVQDVLPLLNSYTSRINAQQGTADEALTKQTQLDLLELEAKQQSGELSGDDFRAAVLQLAAKNGANAELIRRALKQETKDYDADAAVNGLLESGTGYRGFLAQELSTFMKNSNTLGGRSLAQVGALLQAKEAQLITQRADGLRQEGKNEREIMDILKKERRAIQDEAYTELMADFTKGGTETGNFSTIQDQATDNLAQIQKNMADGAERSDVESVFAGTNVLDLYRQVNGLKATDKVYYGQVSNWYLSYLEKLQKNLGQDGKQLFPKGARNAYLDAIDPNREEREQQNRQRQERIREGRLDNIQRGGFGGLGMIDPRGYSDGALALLDRGVKVLRGMFPEETKDESGDIDRSVRSDEGEAPKGQVLALEALTGPGVDPYPVQQTSNDQGDEKLARVINQSNWALFSRIWGSGTGSQSDGAKYTVSTPPMPQVVATKPVPPAPLMMRDSNHPNAVLIGINEGTRDKNGNFTAAYRGHIDPGNSARNQGTFSAQQGFASPSQADAYWVRQINKETINRFAPALRASGLQPGTAGYERLMFNLQDLLVQAPQAATGEGGLVSKIPQLVQQGLTIEAIAKARADSFFIPGTSRLAAAGFGNNYTRLLLDQRRRAGTWDYKRRIG